MPSLMKTRTFEDNAGVVIYHIAENDLYKPDAEAAQSNESTLQYE